VIVTFTPGPLPGPAGLRSAGVRWLPRGHCRASQKRCSVNCDAYTGFRRLWTDRGASCQNHLVVAGQRGQSRFSSNMISILSAKASQEMHHHEPHRTPSHGSNDKKDGDDEPPSIRDLPQSPSNANHGFAGGAPLVLAHEPSLDEVRSQVNARHRKISVAVSQTECIVVEEERGFREKGGSSECSLHQPCSGPFHATLPLPLPCRGPACPAPPYPAYDSPGHPAPAALL